MDVALEGWWTADVDPCTKVSTLGRFEMVTKSSDTSAGSKSLISDQATRAASRGSGTIPANGFNALVPELDVSDLPASLRFWCDLLGFEVAYGRPAARFAYLVRGKIQIMLSELSGSWEVGELSRPFGRGINFQMIVSSVSPILEALEGAKWPLFRPPNDAWYRAGDQETGQREFLVQDPDGYLLRFAQHLGMRLPS